MSSRKQGKKRKKGTIQQGRIHHLDQFNQDDIRLWKAMSVGLISYWVRLFYFLEGQRNLYGDEISNALREVDSLTVNIVEWNRIVDWQYSLEPLSAVGSTKAGGRFNIGSDLDSRKFPAFPALYCAENCETAYAEKFGTTETRSKTKLSGDELALRDNNSFASIRIKGKVHNIFDLQKAVNLKKFSEIINSFKMPNELKELAISLNIPPPWLVTSPSQLKTTMLEENWRQWPVQYDIPSNSQIFGRLLVAAGFEGILYPSTKGTKKCLAIFLENFNGSESFLELMDASPKGVKHNKLDKSTWSNLC